MQSLIDQYSATIRLAAEECRPLCIRGSGSKDFYGGPLEGDVLNATPYRGIVDYEPTELVITARAGTPLAEIETLLAANGQMLAFEPPHFGLQATLGGCVAAGLSGPRRAHAGAVRDFVLGVRMLDGRGDDLRFGGQVMKNVAGYDVSRLMAGSLGTLGMLLEVSLKVLPRPAEEMSLCFEMDQAQAIETMNSFAGRPLPLSASCHQAGLLTLRLSGAASAVRAAHTKLGGEALHNGEHFWRGIREHSAHFFDTGLPLWRLSLSSTQPPLPLPGKQLIEWNGALRWLASDADAAAVRDAVSATGGQAALFRTPSGERRDVFHPLAPALMELQRRLKRAFDPQGIFNRGRIYAGV
jgi:glycolate oxidase FAD binding subunit